jgi:hypothetical protein
MDYIIRNVNGDLNATIVDDTLRGKNSLDMEYKMAVKGDSAYYTFSGIVTGYARISKQSTTKFSPASRALLTNKQMRFKRLRANPGSFFWYFQ